MTNKVQRARNYIAAMPGAVSGSGGHDATFAVACALVKFGLTESEAWLLMLEYNARCSPRWSESDLRHKLRDAFRRVRPDARLTEQSREPAKEEKRSRWPAFATPTRLELHQIGELRNISNEGLALAAKRGLLRCANYRSSRCWFVTDATGFTAQARRLDGRPFAKADGGTAKALTLPGSTASWPIGLNEIESYSNVMLCEGGPDLLAAHHFIVIEGQEWNCGAVALLGASQRLQESVLPKFSGKHVRIFPHVDKAGKQAAIRWAKALIPVAATVDVVRLDGLRRIDGPLGEDEKPVNDLNNLTLIHPDDFENNRELWNLCPA